MKRLICIAVLLFAATVASASTDVQLLTADGTLFSLEYDSAANHPEVASQSSSVFVLTTRHGEEIRDEVVPGSLLSGWHVNPALAYEEESGTLFLFWIHHSGLLFNELLVASRNSDGIWSEPHEFGSPWDFRENLRIAVTRKVTDETGAVVPGISVHLTWWEFDSSNGREEAHYGLATIEDGELLAINELDLAQFVQAPETDEAAPEADRSILKQPLLTSSRDEVVLTFGDFTTRRLHRVAIRPTLPPAIEGRIRIPVGRRDGDIKAPAPSMALNGTVDGIAEGTGMAFYSREGNRLRFTVLRDGVWTDAKDIVLDDEITSGAAVEAIRRLVREH